MIVVFSGTGNSFHVADLLARELDDKVTVRLRGDVLLDNAPVLKPSTDVIWVFPTYSWGIPPVVEKFIGRCSVESPRSVCHHLVVTCGDDIGNLVKSWERILRTKGWNAGGVWSVQMPNTYTLMKGFDVDPHYLELEKLRKCPARVAEIVRVLKEGSFGADVVKGSWPWIKTSVINPWFVRFDMSPKPFHALNNCISCGLCEEQCPTLNIRMMPENDLSARPEWGDNCALCLGCYHHCPVNAIQYGKATRGKGQYKITKALKEIGD